MSRIFTAYDDNTLVLNTHSVPCALGKEGVIDAGDKREGDLKSPLGLWPIRLVFYRPDRLKPPETILPIRALGPNDGWCDDPTHTDYNKSVNLPFTASHERLWREDHVYDLICVLGYNDDPVIPGHGSAIFMHLAREGYTGTEGCVALSLENLLELLKSAEAESFVEIKRA
jgi:L,D-peptidoglycan transpeptidase YkuD (ErfK/YbiS/YcfS/YnhG family)